MLIWPTGGRDAAVPVCDPRHRMLEWDDVRFLLALRRAGTLAAAARSLRTDATTVGRRITRLEARLDLKLFDRTSHGFVATEACERLMPHVEHMETAAMALTRLSAADTSHVDGIVHLTTTEAIAARYLMPHLPRLRLRHPALELVVSCAERKLDLARRQADVALRLARPSEQDVVTKRLMRIELALYASAPYLERRGRPIPGGSYVGHDVVAFIEGAASRPENDWLAANCPGARVVLRSNSVLTLVESVREGLALGLAPCVVGDRDPALVRLETPNAPTPRDLWLAYHEDFEPTPRVRAVIDFLVEVLGG